MTTDTRPTPEALLAEALYDGLDMDDARRDAAEILRGHPTLVRALAIGAAWLDAEAALPDGYEMRVLHRPDAPEYVHRSICWVQDGETSRSAPEMTTGRATPETALHALADALRKERGA